jgi:hypothetical protein
MDNVTRAFIALKDYAPLNALKGDQLLQDRKSAEEFGMDQLIEDGVFLEQDPDVAFVYHLNQKKGSK